MMEFEQTLSTDPLLNKDFEFQQAIVEGIKTARMSELKASLNAIDVSGFTATSIWSAKTITATAVVVIGGIASYFMLNKVPDNDTAPVLIEESISNNEKEIIPETSEKANAKQLEEIKVTPKENIETTKNLVASTKESNKTTSLKEEDLAIRSSEVNDNFDDFDEDNLNHSTAPDNHMISKGEFEHATIDVVIDNNKKKYSFHYQVKDNTLFLFGNFDKVYEVLEFKHGNNYDLFFLYDTKYYNIQESQSNIVPLEEMNMEETLELKQKINSGNEAKSQ